MPRTCGGLCNRREQIALLTRPAKRVLSLVTDVSAAWLVFDKSPAIYGWVYGLELSQVRSGTKERPAVPDGNSWWSRTSTPSHKWLGYFGGHHPNVDFKCRLDRREAIFLEDTDRKSFVATLGEARVKTVWQFAEDLKMGSRAYVASRLSRERKVNGLDDPNQPNHE